MSGNYPTGGQPGPNEGQPSNSGPGFGQPSGPGYGYGYPGQPQNPYGSAPGGPGGPGQPTGPGGPGQPMGPGGPGQPMGPGGPGWPTGPGGPGQPMGPGGPGQPGGMPPTPNKSSSRTLIIIGAAVLALIILGVGAGVYFLNRGAPTTTGPVDPPYPPPSQSSAPPTQSSAPPTTGSPSDAVKAYLEALAAGQAATALALGDETPADKTFLTDAVLAESNRRAPITDINVPEVTDEYTYSVDASYKLGEEAINDKFSVKKVGNGWKVRKAYAELNLAYARNKTLPMLVNKVAVKTDKIRVFPGAYAFTSGNKYVDYGSESLVLVQSPNDYPSMSEVKPTLTDAGLTAFEKSAQAELTACLKKKELAPAGCPFGLRPRSGQKVDESTIVWKLLEDPFANLKPRLDYQNPAIAEASVSMTVTFTAEGTSYGEQTRFGPQRVYSFAKVSADMTREPVKAILSR